MSKQAKRQMAGSGEALPAGAVGEHIIQSGTYTQGLATFENASSITLTPGVWLLWASVYQTPNGATGGSDKSTRLNDQANPAGAPTDSTRFRSGLNYFARNEAITLVWSCTLAPVEVLVSGANKTYYLNTAWSTAGSGGAGNPTWNFTIQAVRIA